MWPAIGLLTFSILWIEFSLTLSFGAFFGQVINIAPRGFLTFLLFADPHGFVLIVMAPSYIAACYNFKSFMTHPGIYIHIPFCRSRCSYCDFATGIYDKGAAERYVRAVIKEIDCWHETELPSDVDTIYLGGGTPSLLWPEQVNQLLGAVRKRFSISAGAEITIEMNPGSAGPLGRRASSSTTARLKVLLEFRQVGINRVSFGAQTFDDGELARLGRTHESADIQQTFAELREAGFSNVSFDLIAGLPGQTLAQWLKNLNEAFALRPEHLSFYLLEVHEGTPLADHIRRGLQPQPDDDLAARMYEMMLDRATELGYEHYEISNLCLPGFQSRHNAKYWTGASYYGFGCSAHSYDGALRRWSNERDMVRYVQLIEQESSPIVERVILNAEEAQAESLFLGLRMMGGISTKKYQELFGVDLREQHGTDLGRFREAGLIEFDGDVIRLTRSGALLSNEVFSAFV